MNASTDKSPPLVLAPDIVLRSAADLPGAETGDLILDSAAHRQHAKLVNAAVGALLEQFRTPKRLPDAVAAMTRDRDTDPFELLTEALPMVRDLRDAGILTTVGHSEPTPHRFETGARFGSYRIHGILRRTRDTEVAMATDPAGRAVSLKTTLGDAGEAARRAFAREIEMARRLSGTIAPEVVAVECGDLPVLVSRWVEGLPLDRFVQDCCRSRADALALAVRVADAYARLHAHGILHGDVRPSNCLVDGNGRVWLLDFGLSQWIGPSATKFSFELSYMEPEAAAPLLDGELPRLTVQGEVCSLGLVLAEGLGGHPVRTQPTFREDALKSISEKPAAIRTGLPALDKVLERATCSQASRFSCMSELRDGLAAIVAPSSVSRDIEPQQAEGDTIDGAVLMLRAAECRADPESLVLARRCLHLAERQERPGADRESPLYTPVGRLLLAARAAYSARRFDQARQRLATLPDLLSRPNGQAELFCGSAGDLAHLARFHLDFRAADGQVAQLSGLLEDMLDRQVDHLHTGLAGLDEGRTTHLGMAHGLAGQIYAILCATAALDRVPDPTVTRGLEMLADRAEAVGAGLAWPGTVSGHDGAPATADFTPGWCSGTAGFLLLWIEAGRLLPEASYRALAEGSALYALAHPDRTPNLCCGLAGRATSLAIYARWIGSVAWSTRARNMADGAERDAGGSSIFRGSAGIDLARLETRSIAPLFPV